MRLADELLGRHADHRRQRLVDADVPEILVEEREAGRRIEEEGVEHPRWALARSAASIRLSRITSVTTAVATSVPAPRIQIAAASCSDMVRDEHRRPERHGDPELHERLPAA